MKLISCYIEGYGKIKQKEYTFSEGLTTIFAENGEGKTTLASFIKAMFYGLDGYRKGSVEFCDREHFYPFEGGLFGGNLTFESGGKRYKIERFFGDKSKTADTFKVYEEGVLTEKFSEELGKELFHVDRESFERTTFFGSGEVELAATSGIHAQLNRFLEGGEEDGGLDKALAAIDKAAKVYKKSKAGNDKVTAEEAKKRKLSEDVENASAVKLALEEKYARSERLDEEIKNLSARVVEAQRLGEKRSQMEHLESLEKEVENAETALQALLARYPHGLPSAEETNAVNAYMVSAKELEAKAEGVEFSAADGEKLSALQARFSQGEPTKEEMAQAEQDVRALSALQAEAELAHHYVPTRREKELSAAFHSRKPTEETVAQTKRKVEEYKKAKTAYDAAPAWEHEQKHFSLAYALLAAFAAVLLSWGAVMIFSDYEVVGIAMTGVGAILLLADGFLYLNKKSGTHGKMVENPERKHLEAVITDLEDAIKATLLPYGYYSGNGIAFDFAKWEMDAAAYEEYLLEDGKRQAALLVNEQKSAQTESRLNEFFGRFGLAGRAYLSLLSELRVHRSDYADLRSRRQTALESRSEIMTKLQAIRAQIQVYQEKYGLQAVQVTVILQDLREIARLKRAIDEGRQKSAAYGKEKGLEKGAPLPVVDLAALQAALSEKQSEKNKLDREIAGDELEAEKLEGYEADKASAEALLKEYKRKHKLLTATAALLEEAEGRLRDKYVKPVRDEFLRHAEALEKTLGEKPVVTKNFDLRFERNGAERSDKHLSTGQRSICALCFRLALVKNMYREQLPFLVLDDPFTALDARHLERVKILMQSLAKDMQILYFTCHESRKM